MSSSEVEEPNSPRENLIETAVKFLQNAKVRDSPFNQRKDFLKKKGLTDEEIGIAIQKSGTAGDEALQQKQQQQKTLTSPVSQALTPTSVPQPESKWGRLRDITATAIVIGGVSSVVYIVYKKYLLPYLFGPSKEEQQLKQLTQSISLLQQTMADVVQTIKETKTIMTEQQDSLQTLITNSNRSRFNSAEILNSQGSHNFNELKEELKSLKGLLLNRNQFPKIPSTPSIPSWQLTSNQANNPSNAMDTEVNSAESSNISLENRAKTEPDCTDELNNQNAPTEQVQNKHSKDAEDNLVNDSKIKVSFKEEIEEVVGDEIVQNQTQLENCQVPDTELIAS